MCNFIVNTVPADGLAPLGARPSAGTVMTKSRSHTYTGPALKGLALTDPTPQLGAVSIRKTVLPGMVIPMLKIRRPNGRLIFNMEIAICR